MDYISRMNQGWSRAFQPGLVWSFGCVTDGEGRGVLDPFFRRLSSGARLKKTWFTIVQCLSKLAHSEHEIYVGGANNNCDIIPAGQSLGLKEDFQLLGDEPDPNKPCLTSIDALCATHCIKFQVHKSPCNEFQTWLKVNGGNESLPKW